MCYLKMHKEYLKELSILKSYIKSLRQEAKIISSEERDHIEYRISILYGMYLEMKHTTEYLGRKCEVMKIGK